MKLKKLYERFETPELFVEFVKSIIPNIHPENIDDKIKDVYINKINEPFKNGEQGIKNQLIEWLSFKGKGTQIHYDYWLIRGWNNYQEKVSEHQSNVTKKLISRDGYKGRYSKEWFIKKYGESLGIIKWNELKVRRSKDNLKENQIKKHGKEKIEQRIQKQISNPENFQERYGNNWVIKWNEFIEKSKQTKNNFITRYGKKDGLYRYRKYIERLKYKSSEPYWIEKYGESGSEKWKEFLGKTILKTNDLQYSKISIILFNFIEQYYKGEYGKNEKRLMLDGRYIFPDFIIGNKIIEFYGDYWHGNPKKYNPNSFLKFPNQKEIQAKEIWEKDKQRIDLLKKNGYNVKIVWEKEFKENTIKVIEECLNFLEN